MTVVALVPAYDATGTIGPTVRALGALAVVDRVLVVDDGSRDGTAEEARSAGAEVLRLPTNRGKGGAVLAGAARCDEADVLLLIDADVGATTAVADRSLAPSWPTRPTSWSGCSRRAAPAAWARSAARPRPGSAGRPASTSRRRCRGSGRCGPGAGRTCRRMERFGLEVAMTIDVTRAGTRLREVAVPMAHRRTGRSPAGFAHRSRQGSTSPGRRGPGSRRPGPAAGRWWPRRWWRSPRWRGAAAAR